MTTQSARGPVRSLVLKAGTVAGVVAVLALPAPAEAATRAGDSAAYLSSSAPPAAPVAAAPAAAAQVPAAPAPGRGRIVDAAVLSVAVAVAPATTHAPSGPTVARSALTSTAGAGLLITSASATEVPA